MIRLKHYFIKSKVLFISTSLLVLSAGCASFQNNIPTPLPTYTPLPTNTRVKNELPPTWTPNIESLPRTVTPTPRASWTPGPTDTPQPTLLPTATIFPPISIASEDEIPSFFGALYYLDGATLIQWLGPSQIINAFTIENGTRIFEGIEKFKIIGTKALLVQSLDGVPVVTVVDLQREVVSLALPVKETRLVDAVLSPDGRWVGYIYVPTEKPQLDAAERSFYAYVAVASVRTPGQVFTAGWCDRGCTNTVWSNDSQTLIWADDGGIWESNSFLENNFSSIEVLTSEEVTIIQKGDSDDEAAPTGLPTEWPTETPTEIPTPSQTPGIQITPTPLFTIEPSDTPDKDSNGKKEITESGSKGDEEYGFTQLLSEIHAPPIPKQNEFSGLILQSFSPSGEYLIAEEPSEDGAWWLLSLDDGSIEEIPGRFLFVNKSLSMAWVQNDRLVIARSGLPGFFSEGPALEVWSFGSGDQDSKFILSDTYALGENPRVVPFSPRELTIGRYAISMLDYNSPMYSEVNGIYLIDMAAERLEKLNDLPFVRVQNVLWSPDNSAIIMIAPLNILYVPLDGGEIVDLRSLIGRNGCCYEWVPIP